MSILLSAELEVDGDLKVTGTIQASTIDSLLSLIAQLEMRIAQLECQNTGIIPDAGVLGLYNTIRCIRFYYTMLINNNLNIIPSIL